MKKYAISRLADITMDLKREAALQHRTMAQQLQFLADTGEIAPALYDPEARNSAGLSVPAWKQAVVRGAGLDPKGRNAATTVQDAFFRDPDNILLFPIYTEERYREVGRETRNGLRLDDVVTDIVQIQGGVVQGQTMSFADDENSDLSRIAEGAEYPTLTITQGDHVIHLYKYGGRLEASKEALLTASLSTFDRWLLKVRRQADRNKIRKALAVIRNGDGSGNPAPNVPVPDGVPDVIDFVNLLMKAEGYGAEPNILTGSIEALGQALSMDIITSASSTAAAADFRDTGTLPVLFGMRPKLPPQRSVLDGTTQLLAIDSDQGLTMYTDPRFDLVQYDEVIRRDLKAMQISEMIGFGKPDLGTGITLTMMK